ncbi:hypothetical protein Tco_0914823 [Tanacetum coccineum]
MSSDNASSTVTYTSISSNSNGLSWGILLVNADELLEMDPYEKVAQQGQAHPLSPAYVPDPIELDEQVFVYVQEPEHQEYHAPLDDDIQVEDQPYADDASSTTESPGYIANSESMNKDLINYPDEPEDDDEDNDEDPKEDPEEDHTNYPADREDGDDVPSDDDDNNDDTDDKDEEPTKDKEEEEHIALADSSAVPVVDVIPSVRDTEAFETNESTPTPRSASMEAHIAKHVAAPIPPTSLAYDQVPLGHRAALIRMRDDILEEDMPPQRRFVLTAPPPRCDVAESSAIAARPPRAANRVEEVGYVRALQASEHRMMTSIEEVSSRDIRLEIDVVRGQRKAYETELHERAEDDAVRQMMRTHVLEARPQIDTVEDTGSSC